uniref:Uncharacterized protein n=1 Tax=Triticum urartu TaxID=4572 RepID=A0A8R7QW38_TRIUA
MSFKVFRPAAKEHRAGPRLYDGREAVGEPADLELRRQRQRAAPEAGDAGLVRLEVADVEHAAAKPEVGHGHGGVLLAPESIECESVLDDLASGDRIVAVGVGV